MSNISREQMVSELYRNIFEAAGDGLIIVNADTGCILEANPAFGAMYGYSLKELTDLPFDSLIHPNNASSFGEVIHEVQTNGGLEVVETHMHKGGSTFQVQVRWAAFTVQNLPCILGVVRDVTARMQAERLLQQRVQLHTREQLILLEISQMLASGLELKPTVILDQLRMLVDYTYAGLFELNDSTLVALALNGPPQVEQLMPLSIPLADHATASALLNGSQVYRSADIWGADPAAQSIRAFLQSHLALLEDVHSWMWVPLTVKGRELGGISIAHAEPNYFTPHHAELALTMANQTAITMVNAQLYEQAQALAKLEERQQLAQELHDAVNQSLFSAGLIAEVLPRLWEKNPDEGRRSLEDLRRLTRGALAEMRGLLAELRPAILTGTELGDLLRQLGNALTGRTNVAASVTVVGRGSLPPDVQVALYRLCQEALSNVAKHSKANRVQIHLQYASGGVELNIQDDGRGFDPERITQGHSGLSMMRERAEKIGATLSITSQPEHGTHIAIRWAETVK